MLTCHYGEEPANGKLIGILVIKKWWIIVLGALLGAALAISIYAFQKQDYIKHQHYVSTGAVMLDYRIVEGYGVFETYINAETWNTLIGTDEFQDHIMELLKAQQIEIDKETVRTSMVAELRTDSRILFTVVTMTDAELASTVNEALLETLLIFTDREKDIEQARVITRPETTEKSPFTINLLRRVITGLLCGMFFSVIGLLLFYIWDDSIYIPESIEKRFQIPALGVLCMNCAKRKESSISILRNNLNFKCKDLSNICLVPVDESIAAEIAGEQLKQLIENNMVIQATTTIEDNPNQASSLRASEGVILMVNQGKRNSKRIEKAVQYLSLQECTIKGAILLTQDENLISLYYGFNKSLRYS